MRLWHQAVVRSSSLGHSVSAEVICSVIRSCDYLLGVSAGQWGCSSKEGHGVFLLLFS